MERSGAAGRHNWIIIKRFRMIRFIKRLILTIMALAVIVLAVLMAVDLHVVSAGGSHLTFDYTGASSAGGSGVPEEQAEELRSFGADCILVLGAGIKDYETPTDMLEDRLETGIELYRAGVSPKILLTGDNGSQGHNELHVMLKYCLDAGIPAEDIFCDHAGFSTQESMLRARDIFGAERVIVVTQEYHEYRALYIGEKIGLDVRGVSAAQRDHTWQAARDVREVLARNKDFFMLLMGMENAVGGEPYDLSGDGTATHGE